MIWGIKELAEAVADAIAEISGVKSEQVSIGRIPPTKIANGLWSVTSIAGQNHATNPWMYQMSLAVRYYDTDGAKMYAFDAELRKVMNNLLISDPHIQQLLIQSLDDQDVDGLDTRCGMWTLNITIINPESIG